MGRATVRLRVACVKSEYLIFTMTVLPLMWFASPWLQTFSGEGPQFSRRKTEVVYVLDERIFGTNRFPNPIGANLPLVDAPGNAV